MKSTFTNILIVIAFLIGVVALMFYFGFANNLYSATVEKQHMNIQRNNFEQSQSYVEGKIQELTKDYAEYNQTTDPTEKQALLVTIRNSFASFDSSKVTDTTLYNFLVKARGF